MSKMKGLKKTLAVFMAALMVMSCWVFTPISFEAEAATDNTSLLNGLSEDYFNTNVTTVYGSFQYDLDYLDTQYYDIVYHNVLYTDGTVSSATATSDKTEYGSSWTGSNGVTVYWYHPQATLMYDGDIKDLPRLGVAINIVAYKTSSWSITSACKRSWVDSGGNGFVFNTNWRGSDGRLNFQYIWNGMAENMGYTSTAINDSLKQTFSDSDNHIYGNLLKFTGTMGDEEYVRTVTPTFAFYGDNGDDGKTITATTTKSITIINYVPLKNALTAALATYNTAAANPNYYTTESVKKFAELAKALVAAKPNNYVNSSKNDYNGYATAAKAAVDAWNAFKGLEARNITFTFKANGGTFTTTGTDTYTVTKTYKQKLDSIVKPTRTGYTFDAFYLENGTKFTTDVVFEDDLTLTARWSINNYKAKFQYKDKTTGNTVTYDTNSYANYNSQVTVPTASMSNFTTDAFVLGDHKYQLTGWTLDGNAVTFPTTMPAKDPTYVAVYSDTFLNADLTALKEQIARADELKKSEYYTQNGYTDEYILALDSAYSNATALNKDTIGQSQQDAVTTAANNLKNILDYPKIKEVTVIFKDETGSVLTDGYATVKWGESVTVPTNPSIANDIENHYHFKGWVGATDDEVKNFCAKVTEDRIFLADFEAEAHTWSNQTIPSTCTSDGAIRHTCTSCGYTYDSDNNDPAHHTWTAEKVVVKAATCHSNGIKAIQCTACKVYQEGSIESIDKTEHNYGEWTVYVAATCTGEGVQVRSCTNDGCTAKEYQTTEKLGHEWKNKTTVPATCTTDGYTKETCLNCGLVRMTNPTSSTGHTQATETVAATCTTEGFTRTYCTKCKAKISRTTISATDHSWGEWEEIVEYTCGHEGVNVRECSKCHQIEYETVAKSLIHHYVLEATVSATCTESGKEILVCSGCGDVDEQPIQSLGGHDMQKDPDESQDATCTSPKITVMKCANCYYTEVDIGEKADEHDFKEVEGGSQAATCGQSGYKTMKCDGCGLTYKEYTDNATGIHDWKYTAKQEGTQLTVTATCNVCGAKAETTTTVEDGHNYSVAEITKQPTCNTTGTMKISCDKDHDSDCAAYINVTLAKNPEAHAGETETATTPATCTTKGKVVTTCKDCGDTIAEYEIPANGHSYAYDSETQGTCQETGSVTLKCSCGDTTTIETSINENAHNYKKTASVDATCTQPAYAIFECQNEGCTKTYNQYDTTDKANGHTWDTATVTQNDNLVIVTRKCKAEGCGVTDTQNIEVNIRHNFSGTVENVTDATCKTAGEIKVYCADEGCTKFVTIKVPVNAKAHNKIKTDYTEPTCTADGEVKTYCEDCETTLATTTIAKLGHDFSKAGAVTVESTCTTDGKQTYKCSRCEETTEVTIPKLGHSYQEVESDSKDATCTEYGWITKKCSACGDTYNELVKELGHTWADENGVVTDPTCTAQGYTTRHCTTCDKDIKSDYTPATGHNYEGDGTVVTPPTCTEAGYTTYTCQNDGCDYSYVGDYTPANGHDYTGENSTTVIDPTCTAQGYTKHQCKNCDYYYIDTYVDATGHEFDMENGVMGTDTETGKKYTKYPCKNGCGEWQYEYVGDGCTHTNWEYVKTIAPTCTEDGYDIYSCPTCQEDEIKTNFVSALGHDWDYWQIKQHPYTDAAGVNHDGLQVCKCLRCTAEMEEKVTVDGYFLVTFYNYDGTRLIRPAYYPKGKAARMPKNTPIRIEDAGYTYTFKGYNYSQEQIDCVTKTMAVIAEYDAHEKSYNVTYENDDGSILQTSQNVPYSQINSTYIGSVPTKASDEYYTYTFSSWSVNIDENTGTATAKAEYNKFLKDIDKTPDEGTPGILTKLVEWIKKLLKKYFGFEF